jgi:hypothetical protein
VLLDVVLGHVAGLPFTCLHSSDIFGLEGVLLLASLEEVEGLAEFFRSIGLHESTDNAQVEKTEKHAHNGIFH